MTDDEIKNLDTSEYYGAITQTFKDGILISTVDTRDLDYEKANKIKYLDKCISKDTEANAPWYKQINALNKQLNPVSKRMNADEAIAITKYVDERIEHYNTKVEDVLMCNNFDDVDSITW